LAFKPMGGLLEKARVDALQGGVRSTEGSHRSIQLREIRVHRAAKRHLPRKNTRGGNQGVHDGFKTGLKRLAEQMLSDELTPWYLFVGRNST